MRRIILSLLPLLGALVLASPAVAADKAAALKRELGSGAKVATHDETGQVRFAGAAPRRAFPSGSAPGSSAPAAARSFLTAHGHAFGLRDQARDLRVESTHTVGGGSSVRFQQQLGGVPVLGGELIVNLDKDRDVRSATGELEPGTVGTTPEVDATAARDEAVAAVAKYRKVSGARLSGTTPRLWIYDARLLGGPGPQRPTLAWRLDVKGDSGLAIDDVVLIDATYGGVLARIPQIEEAIHREVCDGADTAVLPCTVARSVRSESDAPTGDTDTDAAYDHAGDTYDFYASNFGRDSLDGNGMTLFSTVHHCPSARDCPFDNAFWNGSQMVYGDGWPQGDDAVGHELTHGVTDFSAHLFYYYQSGAINESMSDVFGELIDLGNGTGTDTAGSRWQVFEDVPTGPFRDMQEPASVLQAGLPSPDRMTSPNYFALESDQGGVHFNSGVNNKAAYLMTDGDTFNGVTVSGIGTAKVGRLYYDVLTTLLTSASDYADLGTALGQACDDLVGSNGFTAANCIEVRDAVAAVEMETDSTQAPAPEAPAAVCPGGQIRTSLLNEDMEGAITSWQTTNAFPWTLSDDYAHSGTFSLFRGNPATASDSSLTMATGVTIPADADSAFLRFDHAYGFEDDSARSYDGGVLEISVNGGAFADAGALLTDVGYTGTVATGFGNVLAGRAAFTGESNGYRASRATLTSLAGDQVRFRWRVATDNAVSAVGWFVDDVQIYSCKTPLPPPDGDGDGVPDTSDACPTTPGALANGCPPVVVPPDGDGDGVPDSSDLCPIVAGQAPSGCPPAIEGPGGATGGTVTLASAKVRSCKRSGRGKSARVRCTLAGFGAVTKATVTVRRKGKTVAKKTLKPSSRGVLAIKPKRRLRKGTYKVTIVLRDASGAKRTLKKSFKLK